MVQTATRAAGRSAASSSWALASTVTVSDTVVLEFCLSLPPSTETAAEDPPQKVPLGKNFEERSFIKKELDEEGETEGENGGTGIGAYHFGFRMYDPVTGLFFSTDPMDVFHNSYSYVGGNPIRYIDPLGLEPVDGLEECGDNGELCSHEEQDRLQYEYQLPTMVVTANGYSWRNPQVSYYSGIDLGNRGDYFLLAGYGGPPEGSGYSSLNKAVGFTVDIMGGAGAGAVAGQKKVIMNLSKKAADIKSIPRIWRSGKDVKRLRVVTRQLNSTKSSLSATTKIGGRVFKAGVATSVAFTAVDVILAKDARGKWRAVVTGTGSFVGGWGGGILGGAGGSFIAPGPGTFVGAAGGSSGGAILLDNLSGAAFDWLWSE